METNLEDTRWRNSNEILDKYFKEVVTPNFKIEGGGGGTKQVHGSDNFEGLIRLPSSFNSYKDSDYYVDPTNQKFIHFTSLNTFFKIVNSGYFLATQFSNHEDPLEFLFAGNELKEIVRKGRLEELKKYVFSLSMCRYPDKESFDMWRIFGDKGRGLGIVFSFYPNSQYWRDSFLSKVYYGKENSNGENYLKKFENFKKAHNDFLTRHLEVTMVENESGKKGIADTMALFLAFHKNSLFEIESEVRFLKSFLVNGFNISDQSIELLPGKQNNTYYGYRIPILSKENIKKRENELNLRELEQKQIRGGYGHSEPCFPPNPSKLDKLLVWEPFIVIEKVILGYQYTEIDLQKFKKMEGDIYEKLNHQQIQKIYAPVSFELTDLSKQFHG